MISANFLWGNILFGGKLHIDAENLNFEIFESALSMKSVSMPLMLSSMGYGQFTQFKIYLLNALCGMICRFDMI